MNVIIVAKFLKAPKKIMLRDPRTIGACSAALLLLLGLGAFGGFLISGADSRALEEIQVLRTQITEQQDDLDAARGEAQRELNAMSVKLAELQAQSNRLNALGVRLTRIGRLEDGEFNFDERRPSAARRRARPSRAWCGPTSRTNSMRSARASARTAQQLELLESLLLDRDIDASLTPTGLPVRTGYASSGFGHRADPFGGYDAYHAGVDFNGPRGSDILSVADGVVSFAGRRSGYGNVVDVDHGNGYMTRYAHNSQNLAQPGQRVRVGQVIAKMGATGRATGNHVHFEVWLNDRPVNPKQYLLGARG
jgi:murein DD-endopeptidase MepM/ murein hydrolase activator NlpD